MQLKLNLIGLAIRVLFAHVATANCNYREFNVSLTLKLVIPSHDTYKNGVSEKNVCYLSICKEDFLHFIDILVTANSSPRL